MTGKSAIDHPAVFFKNVPGLTYVSCRCFRSQEFCIMKNEKSRLNKDWHLANPMPKNPSLQQRIDWHVEHAKNCNCRQITGKLRQEMRKLRIKIP